MKLQSNEIEHSVYKKLVNDLLHGMYSVEYLARHSVTGAGTDKPALDAAIVDKIYGRLLSL